MIVDKYRTIFVHVPKCAGESIETVFLGRPFNLPGTQFEMEPEKHLSVLEIRNTYPKKFIKYLKFAVIRNPWERVLSWVRYRDLKQNRTEGTVAERLTQDLQLNDHFFMVRSFHWMLFIEDRLQMDFIIRYESLQQDFDQLCSLIGHPQLTLPHINRTKHDHYRKYYDDHSRELVARWFKKDIKHFGYKY